MTGNVQIVLSPGLTAEIIPWVDPGGGTPPSGVLEGIAPGTAKALSAWPAYSGEAGDRERTDYSTIVLDGARMLQFGGVHGYLGPTDIRAMNLETGAWTSVSPNTPAAERTNENVDSPYSRFITTNHSLAKHTYNSLVMLGRKLYVMAGGNRVCWYDFDTGLWGYSDHPAPWYYVAGAARAGDKILVAGSGNQADGWLKLHLYDPATDTDSLLGYFGGAIQSRPVSIVPANGKHYAIHPDNGKTFEITLNPYSCVELQTTGPAPTGYLALDYDPVNQTIGGMVGNAGSDYYAIKPSTREWKKTLIPGGPVMAFHAGRFEPSGCFIALAGQPSHMTWAIRPPAY